MLQLTNARSVVSCQLETRFTLTREGTGDIDTAMLAVSVPALIDVWRREIDSEGFLQAFKLQQTNLAISKLGYRKNSYCLTNALCANLAVTIRTLTGEGPQCVDALLTRLAVMFVSLTLIDICVCGWSETEKTHHDWQIQIQCDWGDGIFVPLTCTQQLRISCWVMFAVSCRPDEHLAVLQHK